MSLVDPVWDELGKIDYLLDQLARSVERSEVERAVYEKLAPRYLERRAELAAILQARADRIGRSPYLGQAAEPQRPEPTWQAAASSTPVREPVAPVAPVPVEQVPVAQAPVAPVPIPVAPRPEPVAPLWAPPDPSTRVPTPDDFRYGDVIPPPPMPRERAASPVVPRTPPVRRAPRPPVSAGVWMTYAGAFLVIVAVAIFTIYAWNSMSAVLKLGVLLAVTTAFYAAGGFMRTKMGLPAVGVALVGVGSAMLLFDSWALINGFGLTGLLPWAVALLVCSLIYWATELRIAGGWFGAIGAAAQVGWWWLLGSALHVPAEWQIAGIALVALVWSLGASGASEDSPLATLAVVLKFGSVALAGAMTVAMLPQTIGWFNEGTLSVVGAATVTALAATVVMERFDPRTQRWVSLVHVPVLLAVFATTTSGTVALVCGLLAVGYGAYAVLRGGAAFATIALAVGALGVLRATDATVLDPQLAVAVLASFFALVVLGGHALSRTASQDVALDLSPRTAAGQVWHLLGLIGLAVVTLAGVPSVSNGIPLLWSTITGQYVALVSWILVLWVVVCARTRDQAAGWAVFGWSFYMLAAALSWAAPGLHSAWHATALLAWPQRGGKRMRSLLVR